MATLGWGVIVMPAPDAYWALFMEADDPPLASVLS